jgi:hypothetical protein
MLLWTLTEGKLEIEAEAEQGHWTERGRAASVSNSDATGRPRRSVLALCALTPYEACCFYYSRLGVLHRSGIVHSPGQACRSLSCHSFGRASVG